MSKTLLRHTQAPSVIGWAVNHTLYTMGPSVLSSLSVHRKVGDLLSGRSRCPPHGVEYKDGILCITAMGLVGKEELDDSAPSCRDGDFLTTTGYCSSIWIASSIGLRSYCWPGYWNPRTKLHRQISVCAPWKKEALDNFFVAGWMSTAHLSHILSP